MPAGGTAADTPETPSDYSNVQQTQESEIERNRPSQERVKRAGAGAEESKEDNKVSFQLKFLNRMYIPAIKRRERRVTTGSAANHSIVKEV